MKLEHKQKQKIVLGIAVVLILFGILDKTYNFNIDPKTLNNITMVLMIAAFALLFSGKKKRQDNSDQTDTDSSIQNTTAQIDTKVNEQGNNADTDSNDETDNNADTDKNTDNDNTTETGPNEQENQDKNIEEK
ncbi:MAG TPA: hypothetical protein VIK78_03695 [Ruminiclostridium sp.]